MKQSQKSVLTVLGTFAAIIIVVAGYGRVAFSKLDITELSQQDKVFIAEDLTNFSSIKASGTWQVELVQNDTWAVETNSLDDIKGKVSITVEDNVLVLKQRGSGFWFDWNDDDLIAKVTMPTLTYLDLSGAADIQISGFSGEKLTIDVSGAAELDADNSQYEELLLDSSGAAEVDFKGMLVTDATVEISGAADLTLTMNGGELTGSIFGAGDIQYYGTVSKESIEVSGAGDISHKK